ncbi:MAG: PA domain-containing protein [Longimicrobiales bacterium]
MRFLSLFLFALASRTVEAQQLRLVAHNDLGGTGLHGAVAVVGNTAIVAAGIMPAGGVHAHLYNPYACAPVDIKLVDVSRPASPKLVGRIRLPGGMAANDVSARTVRTPAFAGDLLAVALTMCGASSVHYDRGIAYFDISDPARPQMLGRYQADGDSVRADSIPSCGAPPALSPERCAASQHTVQLIEFADGRVLSLSTEPGASASNFPSGDVRIVDVTDPRRPVQLSSFPARKEPIFSSNGCRPFRAAHDARLGPDGKTVLIAFYDGGLISVDAARPELPVRLAHLDFGTDRMVEGNAGYIASASVNGRSLALVSEQDWLPVETELEIASADGNVLSMPACEAVFTLYDPERDSQIYNRAGSQIDAEITYLGRGCPGGDGMVDHAMDGMHDMATGADAYVSGSAGKLVMIDRSAQPSQPGVGAGPGCSIAARVKRAQSEGALGVIVAQTAASSPQAFSPDGDPTDLAIPTVQIDKSDGDRLRSRLCPTIESGRCVRGETMRARLRDKPGTFGGLRVIDLTDPAAPRLVTVLHSPSAATFPPRDLGVYAPNRAVIDGHVAFVPWNSDGVRVLDLTGPVPAEIAAFVPPDRPDPTGQLPAKTYVVGVALLKAGSSPHATHLLVSDLNSGLYVLEIRGR